MTARLNVTAGRLELRSAVLVFASDTFDGGEIARLAELQTKIVQLQAAIMGAKQSHKELNDDYLADRRNGFPRDLRTFLSAIRNTTREVLDLERELGAAATELRASEAHMSTAPFAKEVLNRCIALEGSEDGKQYVMCSGIVWCCTRKLATEHWQVLINKKLDAEAAALAIALGANVSSRGRISTEVRRVVWTRDGGHCTRCGSRERLEYDHIIPVSQGGANTARNIELLCETCNRSKSNRIE